VHLTLGSLRKSQTVFYASAFFQLDGFAVPAPAQVTQTVSVPLRVKPLSLFQKISFGQVGFESSKSGFWFLAKV
jgi:hypothetical protein